MRERSLWGWGWADKFPDASRLRMLAEQAAAVLGIPTPQPRTPQPITIPEPRITPPPAIASFCTTERTERARHTYGRAYPDLVRGFRGDFSRAPDVVARPRNEDEISAVLEWCSRDKLAAIPFGGGTSVVRGVERPDGWAGAVSIDLGALARVLELDPISRAARIQAGVLGPDLEAQLAPHGLTLRHFPQSFEFSTLGGWIATRAGGHFATLYTHIDDLCESVRMITPRGLWASRRLPASGAGPSPDRFVLGSEGILGIITEAWMRVVPRPEHRANANVLFSDYRAAVEATRAIAQSGLHPSNCRLLDADEARLNFVAGDGSSVLLLAFESADHPLDAWIARAVAIASEHGGRCPDGPRTSSRQGAAGSWRSAFLDAPYVQSAMVSLGVIADTFETACTWDRFPALHEGIREAVRAAGAAILSCRFTHVYPDGPAPYYTFVARGDLDEWAAIKKAAGEAISAAGGTITHHHAVGRTHRPWYDRERPEPFAAALRAAKAAVDPAGVLNPGVLVGE